jgi:hypothetical protein
MSRVPSLPLLVVTILDVVEGEEGVPVDQRNSQSQEPRTDVSPFRGEIIRTNHKSPLLPSFMICSVEADVNHQGPKSPLSPKGVYSPPLLFPIPILYRPVPLYRINRFYWQI